MTDENDLWRLAFPKIDIQKELIPYDDLHASGHYDRAIQLPGDIIPALVWPVTIGPNAPRLATGQDDGSINVYLKGSKADVGSSTAPKKYIADGTQNLFKDCSSGANQIKIGSLPAGCNTCYGTTFSMGIHTLAPPGGTYCQIGVYIAADPLANTGLGIANAVFAASVPGSATNPAALIGNNFFSPPIDLAASLGTSSFALYIDTNGAGLYINIDLFLT